MSSFTPIEIVDLEVERTRQSSSARGLRHMFLRLSSSPPHDWIRLFENERSFPRHNMWRRAWIEGHHIVIDCVPEELGTHHMRDLKQDVANANARYDEHLQQSSSAERNQREVELQEQHRLQELKKRLGF